MSFDDFVEIFFRKFTARARPHITYYGHGIQANTHRHTVVHSSSQLSAKQCGL